jgi:hypothetical protein
MDTRLTVVPDDPDPDRLLPPRMRHELNDVRGAYLAAHSALAPEVVVSRSVAAASAARLNSALHALREAHMQRAVFRSRLGAQAVGPSTVARYALWCLLAFLTAAETAFAFNGVRYALGQYGQIHRPWEDPLSLVGASAIAALSLALAHSAGISLSWGERSPLRDPEPAELPAESHFGVPIHVDPAGGRAFGGVPVERVLGSSVAGAGTDGLPAPGVDLRPYAHVFHLARSRAAYRRAGWLLVACGIALWTANGVMRTRYLDRLPAPAAAQYGGVMAPAASSGSSGSDHHTTGALIIALSMMAFAGSVIVVNRAHTAAYLRVRDLDKQVRDAEALADAERAIAEDPLRRVAEAEAALHRETASAMVAADNARNPHIAL